MSSHVRLRALVTHLSTRRTWTPSLRRQLSRHFSSAAKSQALRGMHDIYGDEQICHTHIANVARHVAELNGFREISTPILESESVFSRTLGQTSDVVSKEMYAFESKSGDKIAMRPENTAGIVRALIEHDQLRMNLPQRFFYYGPMFRYERPQQGRRRQFHQIGVELLGVSDPYSDVQVVEMGNHVLSNLGLSSAATLEINTLGDDESRLKYRDVLREYFRSNISALSPLSRDRLERGSVLRILDSKEKEDKELIQKAPINSDHLTSQARDRFQSILSALDQLNIPYVVNPRLVRGLDYYSETCFEWVSNATGSAILAGGRYDALVKQMGGPDIPGIGWAAGVERLAMLVDQKQISKPRAPVAVFALAERVSSPDWTPKVRHAALKVAQHIRQVLNLPCIEIYSDSVGKAFKKATKEGARHVVIVGEDEIKADSVAVKDLESGTQVIVNNSKLSDILK